MSSSYLTFHVQCRVSPGTGQVERLGSGVGKTSGTGSVEGRECKTPHKERKFPPALLARISPPSFGSHSIISFRERFCDSKNPKFSSTTRLSKLAHATVEAVFVHGKLRSVGRVTVPLLTADVRVTPIVPSNPPCVGHFPFSRNPRAKLSPSPHPRIGAPVVQARSSDPIPEPHGRPPCAPQAQRDRKEVVREEAKRGGAVSIRLIRKKETTASLEGRGPGTP